MTTPEPGLRDSTDFLERGAAVGVAAKLATYTLLPAAVVVIVVAMTILNQGSGRSITVPGLLAALLGTALLLGWWFAVNRFAGLARIGVRVDASGLTVGDVGPARGRAAPPEALLAHAYSAPWTAVYDARLVIDPAEVAAARRRAELRRVPGSSIQAPTRPPYFPDAGPLFQCKVDPAAVQWPALPAGVVPSHVWTVPVRDLDGLVTALERHGIPVQRAATALGPTAPGAMALQDLSRDPVYLTVADHLRGPVPRSHAALEAAMVRDLGVPPYLT